MLVLALLVICTSPISTVNANDIQDEISYNDATVDNAIVIVAIKSAEVTYGSLTNCSTNIISLEREARPPNLGISKVYHLTYTSNDYLVDVGKTFSRHYNAKEPSTGKRFRKPRDGINWSIPSYLAQTVTS